MAVYHYPSSSFFIIKYSLVSLLPLFVTNIVIIAVRYTKVLNVVDNVYFQLS